MAAAAEDFAGAVEHGLRLSKRLYFGKNNTTATPPRPVPAMAKAMNRFYLPTAPMIYAVIENPVVVDNPDLPSYQPHVYGRCDPPALIPLQLNEISLAVDCFLDSAVVAVAGSWRVHCVMGSRRCDCLIAIPFGEQGSILGVEVEVLGKQYHTEMVAVDDDKKAAAKVEDGSYLKPDIFTLKIPQINGGTNVSVRIRWSQKLLYHDGQFSLNIPFSFPEYVNLAAMKISKKEKIELNVNSGPGTEIICGTTSHPLQEVRRLAGNLGFLHESEVVNWSTCDFAFTYSISSSQIFGSVLLQSPLATEDDKEKKSFCCYLFPGNEKNKKAFRKEIVFVIDISGSMRGKPLEDTKSVLFIALSKLDSRDLFNIIAFNGETFLFSSSLESATEEAIERAMQWINMNFVAGGGTNILNPLNQAIAMLSSTNKAVPVIFLITDGSVEDERHICDAVKSHLTSDSSISPRIYTLGIGSFCNHYFLRELAMLSSGFYSAAYDVDSIEVRVESLFARASSIVLANIAIDFESLDLEDLEVYPPRISDLSLEGPFIISGRYSGEFPESVEAKGTFADMTNFSLYLMAQEAKDIPLAKVLAKEQIEILTVEAWFTKNTELEDKIVTMSAQNSIVSEYTCMALIETDRIIGSNEPSKTKQKLITLEKHGVGFGDIAATSENTPPCTTAKPETAEILVKAASSCCKMLCDSCCCMCCINSCSKMNDQCAIAMTQLLGSLACLGCLGCCELCCSRQQG